ncbi:MAG: class I SAM-dependent rRNA methyltransferase [Proteobacteria bacterium]|nr:class I SAM-dependent rRNA methyltransferase [Pseudomonadota bacterium]
MRSYPVYTVTPKAEKSLRNGHPWVYGEEITQMTEEAPNGAIVDVRSSKGAWLGAGWVSNKSKIRVRIISTNANDRFDEAFFARRIRYAIDYRKTVMGEDFKACRLIFGESDQFPGLVVDRFNDILVVQSMSVGIECRKDMIYRLIVDALRGMGEQVTAIYERGDVATRALEGLEQTKGFYAADGLRTDLDGHVVISENGILFDVNYIDGQKTGYFLDQKYNRLAVMKLAKGRRVLDCFTHTGAFALHAAAGGAAHVTAVDISQTAIDQARANALRNGFNDVEFVCANVFELLTSRFEHNERKDDFIILDPPAFTKSNATARDAYRGYKEINLKAMRLLPRGGYLATCSCSHFMKDDMFRQMLIEAAHDASVSLRQIEARQQGPDHPILLNVPETNYLKFYLFQVV